MPPRRTAWRSTPKRPGHPSHTLPLSENKATLNTNALIGIRGLLQRAAQGAHPATLGLAVARCARTRKSRDQAAVSLGKCLDAVAANCAVATKILPWCSHALHKSRRHLHLWHIRLGHD